MANSVRKQLQELSLGIDDEVINLPFEICEAAVKETQFSLMAKPVNQRKQNLRAMTSALPRLWGVNDEVTGRIIENRTIQFLFPSEESMLSVLRRGPWSFNDWMITIQKWTPLHTDNDLKYIPFWVQIRGIPLHFLTLRMVKFIGEKIGDYIDTDFTGDGAVMVDYVRVRLRWNIDTPLRFKRLFQFGNETSILKFQYEKLRNFCSSCGLMTHDTAECPQHEQDAEFEPDDNDEDDDNDQPPENPDSTQSNGGPEPFDRQARGKEKEDLNQTPSKKRKTEQAPSQNLENPPLVCCDFWQAYVIDDMHERFSKRQRRQSETREGRNWFFKSTDGASSSGTTGSTWNATPQQNNNEGTVGQKPPEPG